METCSWDFIRAKYLASAVRADQYPTGGLQEIAFIGRSNVGKSSLINSLCRHNGLARVSSTPGKTQTINFYEITAKEAVAERREQFYLVDLPGYGYARASKDLKNQWSAFIRQYLSGSRNLKLVCQLIDIRHPLMASDQEGYHWLIGNGIPVQIILTKADKLSRQEMNRQHQALSKALGLTPDRVIVYSSTQHAGRPDLLMRIGTLLWPEPPVGETAE